MPWISPKAAGHKLFNDNCAHCHGPDAVEGVQGQNLRMLHHRTATTWTRCS